jgi:hypothetical protein
MISPHYSGCITRTAVFERIDIYTSYLSLFNNQKETTDLLEGDGEMVQADIHVCVTVIGLLLLSVMVPL